MNYMNIAARAKINLALDVVGKRNDGYHNIKTIMQEIDLCDYLSIEKIEQGFILESNLEDLPLGPENIVYQAWELMRQEYGLAGGIKIHIEKNIPVAAGLAGGSTNAGATLRAIDRLWNLGLSQARLEELGLRLGADVPFCLRGGSLLAQGLGSDFSQLESFKGLRVLLLNPNFPISTELVYKNLKTYGDGSKIDEIQERLAAKDLELLRPGLYNLMEDQVFKDYPVLKGLKEAMVDQGALTSLMSGSGPTIFGIFKDDESWNKAYQALGEKYPTYRLIKTRTL